MAAATAKANQSQKRMEYKPVKFDVDEMPPDAPRGEWKVSIPRGKCKIQPTKDEHLPMIIVPIRLDGTDEDGEEFQKALGTELSVFLVFGGKTPRGEKMGKLRIRELFEAADVDLDVIPKEISEDAENDLEPVVKALEGAKFTAWTIIRKRSDTGEENTEVRFRDPNGTLRGASDDNDDDSDDADDDSAPAARRGAAAKKAPARGKTNGKSRR